MTQQLGAVTEYLEEMRACAEAIGLKPPRFLQPEDRWVDLNGIRFHYLDWGNAHLPHLVLLHGGSLTAHTWDMAALLLRDRYHVVALDQRGHGDSGWTPEAQLGTPNSDLMLADTEAFIDHLGYEQFFLCGHSMGSHNAIRYAAKHPERPDALIIVDSGPAVMLEGRQDMEAFRNETETMSRFEDFLDRAVKFNPQRKPAHLRYSLLHSLKRVEDGWTWKQDHRPRPADAIPLPERWAAEREERSHRMKADLAAYTRPTLLFRGEISRTFSAEAAREAMGVIPDGELVLIPRAGHSVQGDNPRDLARALDAFLTRRFGLPD